MDDEIKIYLPQRASSKIDTDLVYLTEWLVNNGIDDGSGGTKGLLGGQFGYGINYENDIFMMHSYCWCEQPECPWCMACDCPWDETEGHIEFKDQCVNCKKLAAGIPSKPNFLYKPSGFSVWWYKWIGRSSEYSGKITVEDWDNLIKHCRESVKK